MAARFLAGALIGVVTGLLLAPKRGSELRHDLSDNAEKLQKRIRRIARKTSAEVDDLRNILEDQIEGLNDDVRYRMLTILDETEEGVRNVKSTVSSEFK
jgi:gas vesicle protein